jgi:hypothetical protein
VKRWLAHPLEGPRPRRAGRHGAAPGDHRTEAVLRPAGDGAVLEIRSGAGFLAHRLPGLVTSDVVPVAGVRVVLDARQLPFRDDARRTVVAARILAVIPAQGGRNLIARVPEAPRR